MQAATIRRIAQCYGVEVAVGYPVQKGYRNASHPITLTDKRQANLILYKDEPGILGTIVRVNRCTAFLARRGVPVRAPIDARILQLRSAGGARYVSMYSYLPGETIPWEAYTQKHLKLLGKTLSDLQAVLRAYPASLDFPRVTDVYTAIFERMQRYFAEPAVQQAMAQKLQLHIPPSALQRAQRLLALGAELPLQQVLHMDFVRSNVLFGSAATEFGTAITGIIDFEKAAVGHPAFDIARTLAFLLVDCRYKSSAKVRKYFLYSGYSKRGASRLPAVRLNDQDDLVEYLLDVFWLHDFYKFLRHNPYEYLPQNEHFVRTRDMLLSRGVISTTPMV